MRATRLIAATALGFRQSSRGGGSGGAIFFVSNDRTGTMSIRDSRLTGNRNDGFQTRGLPGIFFLGARRPTIIRTVLG